MNFGDITPKQFADNMFGPEDERKEDCIHCGKNYYVIHHKDGVCNACQKKGLPGRSEINKRGNIFDFVFAHIGIIFFAGLIALLIYWASK